MQSIVGFENERNHKINEASYQEKLLFEVLG